MTIDFHSQGVCTQTGYIEGPNVGNNGNLIVGTFNVYCTRNGGWVVVQRGEWNNLIRQVSVV